MARILIVYDSQYGNTETLAKAMGKAIGATVLNVHEAKREHLQDLDALIVGSPTQAFQPLKPMKAFLQGLPSKSLHTVKVAAFDTRMDVKQTHNRLLIFLAGLFGYAAKPMAGLLVKKGGIQTMEPEGFLVDGNEGPLHEGETERAEQWIKQIT